MPAKPAIPTLIPGVGIITEMEDIVPHVLRQVLSTPGKSSTIFDGAVYSFKNLESRYGSDPDTLAYELEKVLNITNIFQIKSILRVLCILMIQTIMILRFE